MKLLELLSKDLHIYSRLGRMLSPALRRLPRPGKKWTQLLEVALLIAWALWVGRAYLNFDPLAYPQGGDFPHEVQGHLFWRLLPQCGACFLWNGYLDGGSPAFAELQGAALHPLAAFGSLVWGAINGEKFMLLCSLVIAALAQWWLARTLRLGWLARVWSGLIIVVCGHWGGYLNNGVTNMVFALANASLILPPAVDLALNRRRRSIIVLAAALALTVVAGQGYIQIGVLLAVLPALLVLIGFAARPAALWKDFLLAGLLAALLSAYMLIPVLHFSPVFAPETGVHEDVTQSIATVWISLISPNILRVNYPIFVGWVPVILAAAALRMVPREKGRLLAFFITAIVLVLTISTLEGITLLVKIIPRLGAARFPILISGLAVPLLIGLAAWGLDLLLSLNWPSLSLSFTGGRSFTLSRTWLVLLLPLGAAIAAVFPVGTQWMFTGRVSKPAEVIQAVQTDTAQWVRFSTIDFLWAPYLIEQGNYKLTDVYRPWHWIGREQPPPNMEVFHNRDLPAAPAGKLLAAFTDYTLYANPANQYAAVQSGAGPTACRSRALGGNIDVTCESPSAGVLLVREYSWSGWTVRVDDRPARLKPGVWLAVDAPAGRHTYTFRYRPWDVPLGLAVSLLGVGLAAWLWVRFRPAPPPAGDPDSGPAHS